MKKLLLSTIVLSMLAMPLPVMAGTHGTNGQVSGRSVGAAALSLLIWPGLGQAVNDQSYSKNATHAILEFGHVMMHSLTVKVEYGITEFKFI